MNVCKDCGIIVKDFARHKRRDRCEKQHIRHDFMNAAANQRWHGHGGGR